MATQNHTWQFHRIGGLDQVLLESDADLRALRELDQKLWVALSCPVAGLEIDEGTLRLLDGDGDGRIRVPELLAAVEWTGKRLKDLGEVAAGSDTLPLASIDDSTDEGQSALVSARRILVSLDKADADTLTLEEAADTVSLFSATTLNGDGVIIEESTEDEALRAVIADIKATVGSVPDRSGSEGINEELITTFFEAARAHAQWLAAGTGDDVLTLGEATADAAAAVAAVRNKVEDWFTRARLAQFDPRASEALNGAESDYITLAAQDLTIARPEIAALPIAAVGERLTLPLVDGLNPAWADAVTTLRSVAAKAVFGDEPDELTEAQWRQLCAAVAPYETWIGARAGAVVADLGGDRINTILAADPQPALTAVLEADLALQPEFDAISAVERLIRYRRDLGTLLRNFVNFRDFYSPEGDAAFQSGTLYLDGRSTNLCVRVAGPNPLAAMSKAYIAYCDCKRPGAKPMKIAACITQGDSDYLFVGRNGVFYDRDGNDWDARITSIVESPISVRQAFWMPYKKLLRAIEETVAKRAAAAEAESDKRMAAAANQAANVDSTPAPGPEPKKVDVGAVAAIGVAITGAISALTLILGYVFGMAPWQYPLVLVGLMLLISAPSMLIAWLKLRQRTLGPILEGNGWAINGRVRINVPFGASLTARGVLPAGSKRSLDDPFVDKAARRRARLFWLVLLLVIAGGIRGHAEFMNEGRYFWQPAPVVNAPAAEEPAVKAPT